MRDFSRPFLAIALLAASAVAAEAQPAPKAAARPAAAPAPVSGPTGDVRCLLTMVALRGQKDQQAAQQGALGVFYFAGRLSSHGPTFDLASAVRTQAATLGPTQLQAELQRCGPMIQAQLQGVQAALSALRPPGPPPGAAAPTAPAPAPAAPPITQTPK